MKFKILLTLCCFYAQWLCGEQPSSADDLLNRIIEKAKQNDEWVKSYGSFQETILKRLESDGKLKSQETRTYRTIWIQDTPYQDLIQVDGKDLSESHKKEEAKRKSKFIESLRKKKEDSGEKEEFSWEELRAKYEFALLPPDELGHYVFTFQPRNGKLSERSRAERILNHLSGTFWADDQHNILRIEAHLIGPVRFGLGIVAKVEHFEIDYRQNKYESVWMPASMFFGFQARLGLFKNAHQEAATRFYDFFPRAKAPEIGPSSSASSE